MREITLFSRGDSSLVTTWSGVPRECADALEALGITVNRVDTSLGRRGSAVLKMIRQLQRLQRLRGDLLYQLVCSALARHQVARACRQFGSSQCNLFLTYSFTSRRFSTLPTVHYCDQCFAQVIQSRECTRLTRGEKRRLAEEEAALRTTDRVLSTNTHGVEFLRGHYGLRNVHESAVGGISLMGYTDGLFPGGPSRQRERSLVFVGSSIEKRGLDILLEAFTQFNDSTGRDYVLDIVGFEAGAVPGDWPNTKWHGRLDKSRSEDALLFWRLMAQATMFVIPSRSGPLPGVILEAQYVGTPVITTNVWGTGQIVEDGKTGLLLDEATPEAVCEAMRRLDADHDLWVALSQAGREHALGYTWQAAARTLVEQMETSIRARCDRRS